VRLVHHPKVGSGAVQGLDLVLETIDLETLSFDQLGLGLNLRPSFLNGQQHFRGWQGNAESLKIYKIRDSIKNVFCEKNNIPLLRLDYRMTLSEITEILENFLAHYKLL
jgi:hypothetical protein